MNNRDGYTPATEASIQADIERKGLNAPRVVPGDLDREIKSAHFFIASDAIQQDQAVHSHYEGGWLLGNTQLLTICVLQLRNGFIVTGESACASAANFDAQLGRDIAFRNARDKLWALLGFRLRDDLSGVDGYRARIGERPQMQV
jgi:hypothetical protein